MNRIFLLFGLLLTLQACDSGENDEDTSDNFNRAALLENWADNIIIPAYENLVANTTLLQSATETFIATPNEDNLSATREKWLAAYLAWQSVDLFEIGKAEEITLRNYMNVFPLDAEGMQSSILEGNYDLTSVNRQDEQGFSAVDFLLYGLGDTDADIIGFYTDENHGVQYSTYLKDVVQRMNTLSNSVLEDWNGGYRNTFVSRDGTSGTESVNSIVNDYMFYYEKFLRAGKIGIPAGVFSGSTLSDKVEGRYHGEISKTLFLKALDASQDFFNGTHFDGQITGIGINDFLDELNTIKETEDLSTLINTQFDLAREKADALSENFGTQIETNNDLMLEAYDELQKNVVFLKVDMLQALNIKVDYVDADGD